MPEYQIEQDQAHITLTGMIRHNTVPHALLFTGPSGTGREATALAMAKALNCQTPPPLTEAGPRHLDELICGHCKSCRKIDAETHPDIRCIRPDGTHIKIAQIRELCDTLLSKPLEASHRLVLINEAGRMNTQAANALLKVLEEPPPGTQFVLTALQPSELLPTIISRCQAVRFQPLSREMVARVLTGESSLSEPEALTLAALCGENLEKARVIIASRQGASGWLTKRRWINESLPLPGRSDVAHALSFAEVLSRDKETALTGLSIIGHYLHDLMVVRMTPDNVANIDLIQHIQEEARRHELSRVTAMADTVRRAVTRIEGNSVVRHTLEVMALELMEG